MMRNLNFKMIIGLSILWMGQAVFAQEMREFYTNARSLAMGGASIAVTNDETSVLLNPAALGRLRDYYGTVLDPEVDLNSAHMKKYQSALTPATNDLTSTKEAADASRGTYFHSRQQLFPSIVMKYIGLGILYNNTLDAEMNSLGTGMDTYYRNDMSLVLGASAKFFGGRIKIGGNAKAISRIEISNPAVDPAGSLLIKDLATEGLGLGIDGGILLAAPWEWLPTLGVVVRDIGDTKFDRKSGLRMTTTNGGIPNSQKQSIDVGVAIFPIYSKNFRSSWTLEYVDAANATQQADGAKKIHAGVEWNFGDIFFVRAGYNQRYFTGGLELASEYVQWQFATYGEEIGTLATPREDRRYVLKFAVRY